MLAVGTSIDVAASAPPSIRNPRAQNSAIVNVNFFPDSAARHSDQRTRPMRRRITPSFHQRNGSGKNTVIAPCHGRSAASVIVSQLDNLYISCRLHRGISFGKSGETEWVSFDEKNMFFAKSFIEEMSEKILLMGLGDKSKQYNSNLIELLEFRNSIDLANIMVDSALLRKESRGAHYRSDKPTMATKNQHTIITKDKIWLK